MVCTGTERGMVGTVRFAAHMLAGLHDGGKS